ncbi:MAG: PKD domain-containing protein [Candidatus Thermoplasmatota archaeon]
MTTLVGRTIAIALLVLTGVAFAAPVNLTGENQTLSCPQLVETTGVGLSCMREDGLLEVWSQNGAYLGLVHGPDTVQPPQLVSEMPPTTRIECVPDGSDYRTRIIYSHPPEQPSRWTSIAPLLRNLTLIQAALLNEAAQVGSDNASLRVACEQGDIDVAEVHLLLPAAATKFSTIVTELRARGYESPRDKYLVFYDGPAPCDCSGMANLETDDAPGSANLNNGNGPNPMFAIMFEDPTNARTWLHELLHTMGAVQRSAPHSTGAGHCTDGSDVMCSYDGGANAINYTLDICKIEVVDCNQDDYFAAAPSAGSYLSTKWNLAAATNRFTDVRRPWIQDVGCASVARPNESISCVLAVADDAENAHVTIDWGDGVIDDLAAFDSNGDTTLLPASHSYQGPGSFRIEVTMTNSLGSQRDASVTIRVWEDRNPPTLEVPIPSAGAIYRGCEKLSSFNASWSALVVRGCVRFHVGDDDSGVASIRMYVGEERFSIEPTAGWHEIGFQTWGRQGSKSLRIEVMDEAGNLAKTERHVVLA